MLNYRRVNFLDLATCKNPIHAFHKDGLVILLILRQLRQQRGGMQTQRGLPQHLVDLAAPQVAEMELIYEKNINVCRCKSTVIVKWSCKIYRVFQGSKNLA
jgi:hypothetical protein